MISIILRIEALNTLHEVVPLCTHFTAESTEAMRIKCLAQGHKILMPGFASYQYLSENSAVLDISLASTLMSLTCNHSIIENFHILSPGNNDFDHKVKDAFYIKTQKPLLNKHLHQHSASFILSVF